MSCARFDDGEEVSKVVVKVAALADIPRSPAASEREKKGSEVTTLLAL
jgi:hypothetical protein